MQELLKQHLEWAKPLSIELSTAWNAIAKEIEKATPITLPRTYFQCQNSNSENTQLHVFADASTKAYGAVAYLCNENQTSLVISKSRVAPLNIVMIYFRFETPHGVSFCCCTYLLSSIEYMATNTDPLVALLCLRATPINSTLPSPAELLFGRPIQDNLPKKIPKGKTTEEVTSRLLQRQAAQKYYHDRNTKPLQPLKPGQSINIQDQRRQTWRPAEIKEKIEEVPRSYIITKPGGGVIRRNRTQIRERPQDPMEQAYQEPSGKTLDNPEIPFPKIKAPKKTTNTQRVAAEL